MSDHDRSSHRCSRCDINWPWTAAYSERCPVCGFGTWISPRTRPITISEARALQVDLETARSNREAFEAYYNAGRDLLACNCGEPATLVDELYTICETCDRPNPAYTLDGLGGWDDELAES